MANITEIDEIVQEEIVEQEGKRKLKGKPIFKYR